MTYRERREARAERLRGWAKQRRQRAAAGAAAEDPISHDWAFITQPGHIPERARMIAREDRRQESLVKARSMAARADGIESQLDHAIYSDDPDAVEALRARLADLEAQRAAIVAYNADCRRAAKAGGHGNLELLAYDMGAGRNGRLQELVRDCATAGQLRPGWALPGYATANLGGNIARTRERLAELERRANPSNIHVSTDRYMVTGLD